MKYILAAGAAVAICASTALAQYSQYGAIENFYQANPDFNTGQYAGRVVNPALWLVDWSRWKEMDDRLISGGYLRLGISSWEGSNADGNGVPQKQLALAYARAIGAEVIIYAAHEGDKYNYTAHDVAFYAKQGVQPATSRPSNTEATLAINRLQDALGKPHVKGGVWYDSQTDTYNWIGPKFGRRMSEPASQFLSEVGPYLY